jgi:oligopeptide transport system substrate-binding protein
MLLFAASCSQSGQTNPKTLRTCFRAEPSTLDPRRNSEVISSRIQLMMFEGLTRLLPEGKIEWALAESAEISPDGKTYLFHLRKANWSDGKPITAYDFEYSWKKVLDPDFGAPSSILFSPIVNATESIRGEVSPDQVAIKALDAKTLEVRLRHPASYFLSLISFCPFFPIPEHVEKSHPNWMLDVGENLVTSGPFRLVSWKKNEQFDLARNETYYDRPHVKIDGIEIYIIPNEKTALQMFEKGEIDWIDSFTTPLALDDLEHLKKDKGLTAHEIGGTQFCAFNLDSPIFSNGKIRHALSAAIDRQALVEHVSPLEERVASRLFPPVICEGNDRDLIADNNISLARELFAQGLRELGISKLQEHPEWKQVCLSYETGDQNRRIAQILQTTWEKALGFTIPLAEMDFKSKIASIENRKFSITLEYWIVHFADPANILDRFKYRTSKKNYPGFEHSGYIALLDQASQIVDPAARFAVLEKAEDLFVKEMPLTPLFHKNQAVLKSDRVESIALNPIGNVNYKSIQLRL